MLLTGYAALRAGRFFTRTRTTNSSRPAPSSTAELGLRRAIRAELERKPCEQLVIVKQNGVDDGPPFDWACNRAHLEPAKIVWPDDMGPAKNQDLIDYFKGRRMWLVDADSHPPKLRHYPVGGVASDHGATARQ